MKITIFVISSSLLCSGLNAESYTIQLMASKNNMNAKKMMAELEKKQIKSTLNTRGDGLFIISSGLYASKDEVKVHLGAIRKTVPSAFIKHIKNMEPIKEVVVAKEEIELRGKPIIASNEKPIPVKVLATVPYSATDDPCVYKYNCGVSIKDVINPSETKCKFITIKYNCTDPV